MGQEYVSNPNRWIISFLHTVGADLSGKVIGVGDGKKLDEDSPYNPACIADNVGDSK